MQRPAWAVLRCGENRTAKERSGLGITGRIQPLVAGWIGYIAALWISGEGIGAVLARGAACADHAFGNQVSVAVVANAHDLLGLLAGAVKAGGAAV